VRLFDRLDRTTLDRRTWELSALALGVVIVLGAGLVLVMYPSVFATNEASRGHAARTLFVSFCVWFVLTVAYLFDRVYVIHKLRRSLAQQRGQIEALRQEASDDLLGTLAGFTHFQDQLTMGFRRAVQVREPLSLVLVRVQPSPTLNSPREVSLTLGEVARGLVRKLRIGDSLFLLSSTVFGIFLPNTPRIGMNRVVERVSEVLLDASSAGRRFRFDLGMIYYPEQASTASEMEQLAYSFSFSRAPA